MGIIIGLIVVITISVFVIWKLIYSGIKNRKILNMIIALNIFALMIVFIVFVIKLFEIYLLAPGTEFK